MNDSNVVYVRPQSSDYLAGGLIFAVAIWVTILLGLVVGGIVFFVTIFFLKVIARGITLFGGFYGELMHESPAVMLSGTVLAIAGIVAVLWFTFLHAAVLGVANHPHDTQWAAVIPFTFWSLGLALSALLVFLAASAIIRDFDSFKLVVTFVVISIAAAGIWLRCAYMPYAPAIYAVSPVSRIPFAREVVSDWNKQIRANERLRQEAIAREKARLQAAR